MLTSTILILGSLVVGDGAVRCSAQDAGEELVWMTSNNQIEVSVGGGAALILPLYSQTSNPRDPDVDGSAGDYAVVWSATDNSNPYNGTPSRIYLSVNDGAPIVVGVGGGNTYNGIVPRVSMVSGRIQVAWLSTDGTDLAFKGSLGLSVYAQVFNYVPGGTTVTNTYAPFIVTPPPAQGGGFYNQTLYNFGDIACDPTLGFVVSYVRAETQSQSTYPAGAFVVGYNYDPNSPTGADLRYPESIAHIASTSEYYAFTEIACYQDGSCVIAHAIEPGILEGQRYNAQGVAGNWVDLIPPNNGKLQVLDYPQYSVNAPMSTGTDVSRFSIACDQANPGGEYIVAYDTEVNANGTSNTYDAGLDIVSVEVESVVNNGVITDTIEGIVYYMTQPGNQTQSSFNGGPCIARPINGAVIAWEYRSIAGDQGPIITQDVIQIGTVYDPDID